MGLQDDVIYLSILCFTFVASFFVKRAPCAYRDTIGALLGLATVWAVCGWQIMYSLPMVLINIATIRFLPSKPWVNFAFCFGYLTFFRCAYMMCDWWLFPKYLPHANAVQLIMTLRCVGLAFEFSDQQRSGPQQHQQASSAAGSPKGQRTGVHFEQLCDSPVRMFYYCYNLVGLFTGPYYSYRVHQDTARNKHLRSISFSSEVITRLMTVPLLIASLLLLQVACPVEYVHTDEFYENNHFLTRLLYSVPVFAWCRFRCYIAWMISEASCMVAGLGAYPKASKPRIGSGPSDLDAYSSIMQQYDDANADDNMKSKSNPNIEYDFETIHNIDAYGCEFSLTFRESMRCWNRSVQYWLATYVYRRCPWRAMRTSMTMLVSAYWHGVHAGYYLSFMTIPLCLYAEDLAFAMMEPKDDANFDHPSKPKHNRRFRCVWWFYRMRGFEYMVMGFLLLSWTSTIRYWSSIGFALQTTLILMIAVLYGAKSMGLGRVRTGRRQKEE